MDSNKAIKMVAYNPMTRKREEVFPEDEVTIAEMTPMFYCRSLQGYVTVPGTTAEDVWDKWLVELRK